jgi:hypothetical protein
MNCTCIISEFHAVQHLKPMKYEFVGCGIRTGLNDENIRTAWPAGLPSTAYSNPMFLPVNNNGNQLFRKHIGIA